MAITHCGIYDADVNLFLPSAVVPTTVSAIVSSTTQSKWGAGALKHTANLGRIIWSGLTGMPAMTGSISFWFFRTSTRKRFLVDVVQTGTPDRILFYVDTLGTLSSLQMYDSAAVIRVNLSLDMSGSVDGAWNYVEANWDWNTGEINVYLNTVRISNSNIGTTYTRGNSTDRILLEINRISGSASLEDYVDDLCLFNTVQHTGDPISVPTAISCAITSSAYIRFGYPFGFRNSRLQ